MGAILEAYVTNLGKYAEGQLVGETLKFPTTTEEVQSLLKRISVDGVRYEDITVYKIGMKIKVCIPVNEKTESHIREKEKMLGTLRQNYESAEIEFVIR